MGDERSDDEPRRDDGLDLARALTRATAKSSPTARKKQRRRDAEARRTPRVSGAHPDDRDPQRLGATVEKLVNDNGWELEIRMRGVFVRWPELVGPQVADHSTPESFADGRLVVRTTSTAWATQLKLLAPTVVRRLNEELGEGTVTLIEVLGPTLPSGPRGQRRVRGSKGPGDTYG